MLASTSSIGRPACFSTRAVSTRSTHTRRMALARAEKASQESPNAQEVDEEARLEALEASMKARRGRSDKNSTRSSRASLETSEEFAEWKEGAMFPEGWERMNPLQKANELYMGRRGFLFWTTKLAVGGVIGIAALWVLFRFVGPALNLYQLANDINTPNF